MVAFIFTTWAAKKFRKMEKSSQDRILDKLAELKNHSNIFSILKPLHQFKSADYRLRIGSYRLILKLKIKNAEITEFVVFDVGDRKEIYR